MGSEKQQREEQPTVAWKLVTKVLERVATKRERWFSVASDDAARGNGHGLQGECFTLGIRQKFPEKVKQHRNMVSGRAVSPPALVFSGLRQTKPWPSSAAWCLSHTERELGLPVLQKLTQTNISVVLWIHTAPFLSKGTALFVPDIGSG